MYLQALVLIAAVAGSDSLTIRFVGNPAFEISDGETTLVTDLPYQSGAFGYMTYDFDAVQPSGRVVAVITHRHADHFDPALFRQRGWEVIGPAEVTANLPEHRVIALEESVSVGEFRITRYRTPHSDTEHYSYLISWDGRRLYFTGDTEDPSHLLSMAELDVAFVTSWLLCAIAERGASVPSRQVILHHQFPRRETRACLEPRVIEQGGTFVLLPNGS